MYSQQWSPAPSITASAPELRTAKRSPARPAAYSSPPGGGPTPQPVLAPAPRDPAREARAEGAVEVAELIVPSAPALVLDGAEHVAPHALGELALIEGRIGRRDAVLRRIGGEPAGGQDGREVELALPRGTCASH